MINAPNYYRATNAAYELLIEQDVLEIPVSLNKLIYLHKHNIHLISYSQMAARFSLTVSEFKSLAPSEFGFTMKKKGNSCILYNEEKGYCTNRFTIAHEIGHIVLEHEVDNSVAEREANCFARNLLCPVPIIDSLKIGEVNDYAGWFHISELAAENSIKNIASDRYYIEDQLYGIVDGLIYTFMTGESLASAYGYSYYN